MLSRGPGVGWRGGIFLCAAHCNMFAVSHPKHVPFSARRSHCSQTGKFLGQTSCAGLHGRTVTGSRAWAWWRARARVGGPRWVRMHRGSSYATQMSPGSLVRRGGWGGGEKCVFMGCNVFPSPSPSDSQHGCCSPQPRLLDKLLRNRSMTHK